MTTGKAKRPFFRSIRVALGATFLLAALPSFAALDGKAFPTPEKAVESLVKSIRSSDLKALVSLLGKESASIVDSGDPVRDKNDREAFLALFDRKNSIRQEASAATLIVGEAEWPFPIPMTKTAKGWQFDPAAGREEIVNRRIGRNELQVIQSLLDAVDAERAYYAVDHDDDGLLEFASKFRSSIGRHDGLFWPTKEGESPSPLSLFVAEASAEGYSPSSPAYYGYHFRILTAQGPRAAGGEYDYMVRDNLIGGFAVVAWPAEWGDSGVMTFQVSHHGVIFQKDLGKTTAEEAAKITIFDPGDGWTPVDEKDLERVE